MSGIIDTHTHLESFHRKGLLPGVLERAAEAGIERLITIGTGPEDWALYRDLARAHPGLIDYTVGIHPCSVDEDWEGAFDRIEEFFSGEDPPVALGETGLDRFHLPKNPGEAEALFDRQRAVFARQLALAGRLDCPVVVHSRGAFRDCVEVVDASGYDWSRVVFHCFSEGAEAMAELIDRGGYGSFTGIITYKTAEPVRAAARRQGLDRLMIETDAPYLAPVPHRGKPNEPAYLRHTAEACAEIFGVAYDELADRTSRTARRFFGIPG